MKKLYFAHGKESGPRGSKINALAAIAEARGYMVESPTYTEILDPDKRVAKLEEILKSENDLSEIILVGSSMGGYVSTVLASELKVKGLFLMAPALFRPDYKVQEYAPLCEVVSIVHGWSDDVIPVEGSIRFARENKYELNLIDGDHRLNSSLDRVCTHFSNFLDQLV